MPLLFTYVGLALSVSFLCSILEAALLSTPVGHLLSEKEKGSRTAASLLRFKEKRLDDAITAILTLNTIAHTIGAAMAGAQAAVVFGSKWLGLFSAVLTLVILVVTEIIPKTLGASYAVRLVPFVAVALRAMVTALLPVLFVTRGLTRLLAPKDPTVVSRGELAALVGLATRQGVLRGEESRLLANALRIGEVKVIDVMTPRSVVAMMPADATVSDLLHNEDARSFSRIPLYEGDRDHVVGYIFQREALAEAIRNDALDQPLRRFARTAVFFPDLLPASDALRQLIAQRQQMAIIADEYGMVRGLLAVEDLIETVLGEEILGELDRVADLRAHAAQMRDQRLARLRMPRQP